MRFVIYKNSVLATLCSIFGASFIAMAVMAMVSGELEILSGIILIVAGVGLMWLGDFISTKKAEEGAAGRRCFGVHDRLRAAAVVCARRTEQAREWERRIRRALLPDGDGYGPVVRVLSLSLTPGLPRGGGMRGVPAAGDWLLPDEAHAAGECLSSDRRVPAGVGLRVQRLGRHGEPPDGAIDNTQTRRTTQ